MNELPLSFTRTIAAPTDQLYRAFTNASALREWLCDVSTTAVKVGGHIFMKWESGYYMAGEFTALQPDKALSFTWHGRNEPAPTQVELKLQEQDGRTRITLTHSGMTDAPEWQTAVPEFKKGWQTGLDNLVSVYETGEDQRFVRRPMLGITVSDFNEAIAAQLGVPVHQGIRLDGVVPDMGAAAAGLQSNDVLQSLAGQPLLDWNSLNQALSQHYAGDTVELVFYRGAEKKTTNMTLSHRPLPEIPPTAVALADTARAGYDQAEAELSQFLAEVSEAEADFHPGPEDWNVKEVLAHLIHGERGWQEWMGYMIGGQEPLFDDWAGNLTARNRATVSAFPTVVDLLTEWKRLNAETVALVANLPETFVARKGTYWRLAYNLLESPYHLQSHIEQMRTAVAQARQQMQPA